ncbi:MAG: 2-oxoglutarate and iron-dependent oxygenase domain-containing protein [Steroidobacteraceae bacterium]
MEPAGVPTLSLADYTGKDPSRRDAFCTQLYAGLTRYGFVILVDHGVSQDLLARAYELSAGFFAQPEAVKRDYVRGPRGYTPFRTEKALGHAAADLKEFWQIGPERPAGTSRGPTEPPNVWPAAPAQFRETCLALYRCLQQTGRQLLEALAPGLAMPRGFFSRLVRDGNSVLRLIHYPPVPDGTEPGSLRSAPHEDINLLTLLVAAQGPGLELLDRDGRWLPVEAARDALIVDSGDMLARMTNDVIPATTHRVVNPAGANTSRYSIPFFMHPDSDALLSCLPSCIGTGAKYPAVRADVFLEERLRAIGLLRA